MQLLREIRQPDRSGEARLQKVPDPGTAEVRGVRQQSAGAEPVKLALEGPVSLVLQGQGAHLASLSQGEPLHSVECKAALLGGKKIASVTLVLDRGGDLYRTRIDGQTFHFRQFTGPAVDANRDDGSLFLERMQHIQNFTETFYALYGVFLKLRTDDAAWDQTLADIRAWLPTLTAAR